MTSELQHFVDLIDEVKWYYPNCLNKAMFWCLTHKNRFYWADCNIYFHSNCHKKYIVSPMLLSRNMIALEKIIESINNDEIEAINSEIPEILSELYSYKESIHKLSKLVIESINDKDYSEMIKLNSEVVTLKI